MSEGGVRVFEEVQYPAIRAAIENDFKLMRSATLPARLSGHFPANILEEMQRGFVEETDYLNEGRNLDFFREKMSRFSYLNIPKVFWELTTDRVLTMSFIEGVNLRDYLSRQPAPEMKNLTGNRLYELFVFQMQTLRAMHADPHPGNYLVGENGRIGLVDFGCVKRISPDILELRLLLPGRWDRLHKMARDFSVRLGVNERRYPQRSLTE